jgi:hypothetical protein
MKEIEITSTIDVNLTSVDSQVDFSAEIKNEKYYHSSVAQTEQCLSTITDNDDDDEFGGGCFDVVAYRAASASDGETDESDGSGGDRDGNGQNASADGDDEDDEFGGGSFNVEADKARRAITAAIAKNAGDDGEDDEAIAVDAVVTLDFPLIAEKGLAPNKYLVNGLIDFCEENKSITIPLVVDTEFYTESSSNYQQQRRTPLTTQIKGVHVNAPKIGYALHPAVNVGRELAGLEPFVTPTTTFHLVDYLRDVGIVDVEIREAKPSEIGKKPKCTFVMYAHFATAELNVICSGTVKQEVKQLQRAKGDEQINATRRLFCQTKTAEIILDYVSLKHILTINGFEFEMCLKIVDTCALQGIASYGDLAKAVGHKLLYKDNFTNEEKARMIDMVIERAKEFEEYALGDLDVYEILVKFDEKWKIVYKLLDLNDYYREPQLTIGSTIKQLFEARFGKFFGLTGGKWTKELNEIFQRFFLPGSVVELRTWTNFTRAILSKVEGGRCRNNRPTELSMKSKINSNGEFDNPIADLDIGSAYVDALRCQEYPIGVPEIFDYKQSENNDYITLREWLTYYEVEIEKLVKCSENEDYEGWKNQDNWGELLSGLWQARITNSEPLKYSQDYFASWFLESSHGVNMLAKRLKDVKSDTETVSTDNMDFDVDMGNLKVFNNDIKNGVLTHDGLQWILAIASKRQRNELLDKLTVSCSAVYCASERIVVNNGVDGLQKLTEIYDNWTGLNTTQRIKSKTGKTTIVMNFQECHAWFSVNLGDLLVDTLLIERKTAQIKEGKKSPLDQLFKLSGNTLYGDMVCKFFITSNPVVGNSVTGRVRCVAWGMEKVLHGCETITDGCGFQLNRVLFPGRDTINGECVNLHRENSKLAQWKVKKGALKGENIVIGWIDNPINDKAAIMFEDVKIDCKFSDGKIYVEIDKKEVELQVVNEKPFLTGKYLNKPCDWFKLPYLLIDGVKIEKPLEWIDKNTMPVLQDRLKMLDVFHKPSEQITVDKVTLEVVRIPRIGQFSFEAKDVYHSASFHGSANYLLENPNEQVIKARGYETKREHTGIEIDPEQDGVEFVKSDRYGTKNNPAKDLMKQLLNHPESIKRQNVALKSGILKVGDYKNLSDKYDELGLEPGDNILKPVLMQEYSPSQFTYQTYEQFISWKKATEKAKMNQKQSLEGYFLNDDCTLNLQTLCEWVDGAIARGVMNPFDELKDKNRNDRRTEKTVKAQKRKTETRGKQLKKAVTIDHPHLETLTSLKAQLNNPPD